jgi:hypothetical protein
MVWIASRSLSLESSATPTIPHPTHSALGKVH